MRKHTVVLTLVLALASSAALAGVPSSDAGTPSAIPTGDGGTDASSVLKDIDATAGNLGDYSAVVRIQQKAKDGRQALFEFKVFRRDSTRDLMILMTAPKTVAGKGYLRIDRNLWEYDASSGRWERRTIRTRIGGSATTQADFDLSNLAEEYTATEAGPGKVGGAACRKLRLTAKEGVDVVYPTQTLCIDDQFAILQREGFAASGKLLRTETVSKHMVVDNPSTKRKMLHPKEIQEVEEEMGVTASVRVVSIELTPLPAGQFTKGWLEGRSR